MKSAAVQPKKGQQHCGVNLNDYSYVKAASAGVRIGVRGQAAAEQWPTKDFVYPKPDLTLLQDDRAFANLLKADGNVACCASCSYFQTVQIEIDEPMRRTLTEWMFEVTDEERCDCEVFPLAVHYVDRFLSVEAVLKSQLQALGTACVFLASKVKQPQPLQAERLCDYTDNVVTVNDLVSWELLVLNRLGWRLVSVSAGDVLDHLLFRLRFPSAVEQQLRPHLQTLIALVATNYQLAILPPSVIAVCCLCFAVSQMSVDPTEAKKNMLATLLTLIGLDDMTLFEPYIDAVSKHVSSSNFRLHNTTNQSCDNLATATCDSQSKGGTPTDIRDVGLP